MTRRFVLVGTGVAAISAAEAIHSVDTQAEIILVSEDPNVYYSRPGLAYYLANEIPDKLLFPFTTSDYQRIGVRYLQAQVTRLDPARQQIELTGSPLASLSYDRLLLATGATAARLALPGRDAEGVVKLDHLEDARRIVRLASKARQAVVVGGGITALELAEGLRARRVKVHYLLRGDRYWSNVLDETESRLIEHRLKEDGVRLHFNSELGEIICDNGRLKAVKTLAGELIPCQILAAAIGIRPRIELAQAAGLKVERGILVDPSMQTSQAGIYAAGDAAQVFDPALGKHVLDSLWGPARAQGQVAGMNMAGQASVYNKPVAFNVTRLAGLTTTIIGQVGQGTDRDLAGIARGDSETWRQLPDAISAQAGFAVNRLRLLVGERTLLGAVVMGDQTLSLPLQTLVTEEADITAIKSQLLAPNAPLADLVAAFWTEYKNRHAAQQP